MDIRRVFIAGTIQGSNRGTLVADQGYRVTIPSLINSFFPEAECFDPSADVTRQLVDPELGALVQSILRETPAVIDTDVLPPQINDLRTTFHAMTREVENCDLCIAYLPDRVPSMGTAMEMYAAFRSGVPVVAVTEMVENLAILSTSSWIVRDLDALEQWLSDQSAGQ